MTIHVRMIGMILEMVYNARRSNPRRHIHSLELQQQKPAFLGGANAKISHDVHVQCAYTKPRVDAHDSGLYSRVYLGQDAVGM
jgi:hypothetical protein